MLLYLDDYPYAEIAAILGISETNVGTKIGRIKERLRCGIAAKAQQ
jgi:DNA-directed RNA polymerase specialized sigma24 family protein